MSSVGVRHLSPGTNTIYKSHATFLWHYLKPHLISLAIAMLLAALLAVVASLVTTLIGPAMQVMTAPSNQLLSFEQLLGPRMAPWFEKLTQERGTTAGELLRVMPPVLIGLAAMRAIFTLFQWYLWERAGELISLRIRDDLTKAFLYLDPNTRRSQGIRSQEGALSSAISTDIKLMREYITHFYGGLPRELLQLVFLGSTLVLLSPKLTVIFFLGVAPVGIVISRIGKKLRKRASKALADYSELSEWLQQRLLGIETIKHYGTEALEESRMRTLTQRLFERFLGAARIKARTSPIVEAMAVLAMTLVLIIAMKDVASGQASGAVQMSFFSTLALLSQSAGKLGRYINSNREGSAAVDRVITQFLILSQHSVESITKSPTIVSQSPNRIICKNISAQYEGSITQALTDFTFTFEAGKIYCLAGPSGAGKSTLFNILLGIVSPSKGKVEYQVDSSWKKPLPTISYMPQKVLLLPDSLAANVAYPDTTWDIQRVEKSLREVGLEDLYLSLEKGLLTAIGEGGKGLSGGQAQRVLLARLTYHAAPFILVDEGTSALDPETERLIQQRLRELSKKGHVVITIAHRESILQMADITLRLEGGHLKTWD